MSQTETRAAGPRVQVVVCAADDTTCAHLCELAARTGLAALPVGADRAAEAALDAVAVIVDVTDPGAAEGLLREIEGRTKGSEVPMLAVVGELDDQTLQRLVLAGADDFVRRSAVAQDLPARLSIQRRAFETRDELRRRERDLRTLVELTRSFAGALDAGALLGDVTRRLAEELSLRRCSIVLIDEKGERGTVVAASDDAAVSKKKIDLFKYPEILEALRTRRAVVVADAERHPLLDPVKEAISAAGLGALAVLPMVLEDKVLGVLFLRASTEGGRGGFSPREIGFAATIANATAVALRNARSMDQIRVRTEQAEAKARELARFEDIYQHVSDGIVLVGNADGRVISVNPAGLALLNLTAEGARGKKVREIAEVLDLEAFRSVTDRLRIGEQVKSVDVPVKRQDGQVVDISVAASRLVELDSTILSFRDNTERKRFQAELQRTNAFLERLIDSSVDGIVAADMKGKILLFNKGAETLLGYKAAEAVGKLHVTGLYPDNGAVEVMRMLRGEQLGGRGRLSAHKREVLSNTGERIPVQMTAALIQENGLDIASVGIFTDLRERLRIEDKLVFTQSKLEKSERQAMIAELAGTAAHELNQPLTSVMGYAELLKRKLQPTDPLYRAVDIIFREAERMAEIVRKIGKITRYETKAYVGQARIVDLERATEGSEE